MLALLSKISLQIESNCLVKLVLSRLPFCDFFMHAERFLSVQFSFLFVALNLSFLTNLLAKLNF